MNNVRLTKENLKENKKFTALLVIGILIIGLGFAILVKINRDAQVAAILKELNSSSNVSVQSSVSSTPAESKIEKLLRLNKVVSTVKSNVDEINIEASVKFSDTGLKIDQNL